MNYNMALYLFLCKTCNKEFDKFVPMAEVSNAGEKQLIECEFCKKNDNVFRIYSRVSGMDKQQQPWEYEYTHKMNPKFVRDSSGNRMKFDPNTMKKGRKGSGL